MKTADLTTLIGNTPHLRVRKLFPDHEVWVKLESLNPGGSIKDRIALAMIEDAEASGRLRQGGTIVEPTSGNTGIGLAMAGAAKGYSVVLVMPSSMSVERRFLLAAYGAELVLTPREEGMKGAIAKASQIVSTTKNAFMPMQFQNQANPDHHYNVTAAEILADFPDGFDYMITGIGTGGHISGVGKKMKEAFPDIRVMGVEPALSPVITTGQSGPHPLQGIGAGFIPDTLNRQVIDDMILVDEQEAYVMVKRAAREEGLLVGISSGASLAAIRKSLPDIPPASRILTFAYDTGERYLSAKALWEEPQ